MVNIKNQSDIKKMAEAGRISANALKLAGEIIEPGITTNEIDREVFKYITQAGATPSFLNYNGFPKSICVSINDTVIHGIADNTKIKNGDIVSIDVGAFYLGFHGDNASTYPVGEISENAQKLLRVTEESLQKAISLAAVGNRIGDISNSIESYVTSFGFYPVRQFVGHGIGTKLHEEPEVPNFGPKNRGVRLCDGMTIAIEPMINEFSADIDILDDGWTVKTLEGGLSAHFEHTVLVTKNGPVILTLPD